jgi:hypothetical protein
MKMFLRLTLLGLLWGLPVSAQAYKYMYYRGVFGADSRIYGGTTMHLVTCSVNGVYADEFRQAARAWNAVAGMSAPISIGTTNKCLVTRGNRVNEVAWLSAKASPAHMPASAVAVAWAWYGWKCGWVYCNDWVDHDIYFNSDKSFTTSTDPGASSNFRDVAIHELGHTLSLMHEDRWLSSMGAGFTMAGQSQIVPHADDRLGGRFLYASASKATDAAALRWKYAGILRAFPYPYGTSDPVVLNNGATTVRAGDWVKVEYNMENLGTEAITGLQVNISLSRRVTTGRRGLRRWRTQRFALGSETWSLPTGSVSTYRASNGQPYTHFVYVKVPSDVPTGTFNVDVQVDPAGKITDNDRGNNDVALGTLQIAQR